MTGNRAPRFDGVVERRTPIGTETVRNMTTRFDPPHVRECASCMGAWQKYRAAERDLGHAARQAALSAARRSDGKPRASFVDQINEARAAMTEGRRRLEQHPEHLGDS